MKDKHVIVWLLRRISKRLPALACLVLSHAGNAMFGVLFALGSRAVVDEAVSGDIFGFKRACLMQLAVILGMVFFSTVNRALHDWLMTRLNRDWKKTLLSGLLWADYAKTSGYHSGELLNRMNNDVRQLDDGLTGILPSLVAMVVRLLGCLWVLVITLPKLTGILALLGVIALLCTGALRGILKKYQRAVIEAEDKVVSFFQEMLERLLGVQAMGLSAVVEERADGLLDKHIKTQDRRRRMSVTANSAVRCMYLLAGFVALVWSAFHLLHGEISFGTLTVVTQLVSQLQAPFVNLSGVLPRYVAMLTAAERIMELEEIGGKPRPKAERPKDFTYAECELVAENVSFSYGNDPILSNASFRLPLGGFSAITGPSGVG